MAWVAAFRHGVKIRIHERFPDLEAAALLGLRGTLESG